jgi:hypothetical protein
MNSIAQHAVPNGSGHKDPDRAQATIFPSWVEKTPRASAIAVEGGSTTRR